MKSSLPSPLPQANAKGFTLVEAIVSVAAMAVLVGIGVAVYAEVRQGAANQKLRKDVTALNAAITVYIASGGSMTGVSTAAEVLNKLKTTSSSDSRKQMVGLRESALDYRMMAEMQNAEEAAGDDLRAIWDADNARFVLDNTGANGVARFVIDETASLAETSESRVSNLKYAKTGRWVWDYTDQDNGGETGPANLPPGGGTASLPALPTPPAPDPLTKPIISSPGGDHPLNHYPLTVEITDPNPVGSSQIYYSQAIGVWSLYTDPIVIEPGDMLEAMAVSIDPDHWVDSPVDSETYTVAPIAPELAVSLPDAMNYIELGGPLMPGSYPAPTLADPAEVSLLNGADIPASYQNNGVFQVYWTKDGTHPLTSGTREEGDAFSGGFANQQIPLAMDDWGTEDTLVLKVAAESFDESVLSHSGLEEKSITVDPLPLRQPVVSIGADEILDITLVTDLGDMPVGARIYYTTDGTDPGIGLDNNPVSGELYTGPVLLDSTEAEIVARVYPPDGYNQWFSPSEASGQNYTSPYIREVFIGGRFALSDGSFRNVAKLGEDGSVDFAFNPGMGASYGSTVGVILPQNGGKLLAGGDFDSMGLTHRYGVVRLNGDGTVDTSFDAELE